MSCISGLYCPLIGYTVWVKVRVFRQLRAELSAPNEETVNNDNASKEIMYTGNTIKGHDER